MINFVVSYTAANQDEFNNLVRDVDVALKTIKSHIPPRQPRKIWVRANYGDKGLVVLNLSQSGDCLTNEEGALRFEGVSLISNRGSLGEKSFHLVVGELHFLVTYA